MTCEYCHTYPHIHGCPGERRKLPKAVCKCEYCGEPIREGQEFYHIYEEYYHCGCLKKGLDISDVLEMFGINKEEA